MFKVVERPDLRAVADEATNKLHAAWAAIDGGRP
jgi:hypothetical protein